MIQVQHSRGTYRIHADSLATIMSTLPSGARVITDANVRPLWTESSVPDNHVRVLPPGESNKSLDQFGACLRWLAETEASRRTPVVAVGGGVIGDLVGFVAAAYMRGVPFIQVPTTLLSQVDSSVGGKVGIDLPEGKNLAGAFHPPTEVRLPNDVLAHLPERQFHNGMAEVLKYGFIMDADLIDTLPDNRPLNIQDGLTAIVMRCIALKAQVVEEDEYETTGRRAILNFGHTVGHAIEHVTGYGPVLHGEAISIGMVVEARLGERIGVTPAGVAARVEHALRRQGLPVAHPVLSDPASLLSAMRRDKKNVDGRLAFSLLTDWGACKLVKEITVDAVVASLNP